MKERYKTRYTQNSNSKTPARNDPPGIHIHTNLVMILVHKSFFVQVPLTLINSGLALRSARRGGGVLSLPAEEQVILARRLADSRSDLPITRHLRSNHDCLIAVCSHVFDPFSVVA